MREAGRARVRRPGLVIFDCDGVLVETEAAGGAALYALLKARGETLSFEELDLRYRGRKIEDLAADFFARLGQPYDPGFPAEVRNAIYAALREGVEAIPGAPALVRRVLEAGLPCCVASSGALEKMQLTLSQVGLYPLLKGRLFTAVDVARGKPAPDVFLHAARGMGVAPGEAVVIEDSPAGVEAALAAGMRVLGYTAGRPRDEAVLLAAGAETVARLEEVPALIGLGA